MPVATRASYIGLVGVISPWAVEGEPHRLSYMLVRLLPVRLVSQSNVFQLQMLSLRLFSPVRHADQNRVKHFSVSLRSASAALRPGPRPLPQVRTAKLPVETRTQSPMH